MLLAAATGWMQWTQQQQQLHGTCAVDVAAGAAAAAAAASWNMCKKVPCEACRHLKQLQHLPQSMHHPTCRSAPKYPDRPLMKALHRTHTTCLAPCTHNAQHSTASSAAQSAERRARSHQRLKSMTFICCSAECTPLLQECGPAIRC